MTSPEGVLAAWLYRLNRQVETDPEYKALVEHAQQCDDDDEEARVLCCWLARRMLDPTREGILANPEFVALLPWRPEWAETARIGGQERQDGTKPAP